MNTWAFSFAGFIDYSGFFTPKNTLWTVLGSLICAGTFVSVIPQIVKIILRRTSFGLNPLFVCLTNLGHFSIMSNIIIFHTSDFVALLQISFTKCFATFLTFFNIFALGFGYQFVVWPNLVLVDTATRPARAKSLTKLNRRLTYVFTACLILAIFTYMSIYIVLIVKYGINSSQAEYLAGALGMAAVAIGLAQYIPQIVTTCKLRDPGSLSMLMLGIQFPGGMANALFMWIGQHESWTSWGSTMSAAIQQMILFIICVVFKLRQRHRESVFGMSLDSTYQEIPGDRI
jgi:hypothetical protein